MRRILLVSGLTIGISFFALAFPSIRAQELNLDTLMAEALRVNPDLKATELKYRAFDAKIPQASSWPDPMFQAGLVNLSAKSWTLGKAAMSGMEYMLSQTIPFPGKLGWAKRSAQNMALKSQEDYQSAKNFVLSELKQNYYQLFQLQKSIEIAKENKHLLEDFAHITNTRYSVGEGLQQDVLKAQVEVSKMLDELIFLEEMRKGTCAQINVLLNRNPQDSLGEVPEISFRELNYSEEDLQNLALRNNPSLKGMGFEINASKAEYKMAQREVWPDLRFSLSYMRMGKNMSMAPSAERNFVSASAGLEIPLYFWSKQKKKIEEESFNLKSSQQKYEGMRNDLQFMISDMFYSLKRYQEQIELYRTAILPQSRQSLESAQAGYQVGKVDFMTLLDNQMTLYNYEIAFYRALSSYFQTVTRLEELVGKPLV